MTTSAPAPVKTVRYNDVEFKDGTARLKIERKDISARYSVVADQHNGTVMEIKFIGEAMELEEVAKRCPGDMAKFIGWHTTMEKEGRQLVKLLNS